MPTAGRRGLTPLDPVKHARFKDAVELGFTYQTPTYPIDKSQGITNWQMDGNGPDPTLTAPFAAFAAAGIGNCGACEIPAHANMLTAAMVGLALVDNTMTANQVATLYFIYQAQLLGITWDPSTPPEASWDVGVDLGDWLLWLATHDINGHAVEVGDGVIEAFVAIKDLANVDSALATFDVIVGGWILPPNVDEDFENENIADVGPGNEPDPEDGHCFGILGVQSEGGDNEGDTWGGVLRFTGAFRKACLQQAFAALTRQEAEAKGFTAQFDAAVANIKALGGTAVTVQPTPDTPPTPDAPPAPAETPVLDPASSLPLYITDGTGPVDAEWTQVADVTGPDAEALFTFAGDTVGGAPTGVGGSWSLFQGTVVPVAPAPVDPPAPPTPVGPPPAPPAPEEMPPWFHAFWEKVIHWVEGHEHPSL